jgi:starch synthase (maltosyl-transferring)
MSPSDPVSRELGDGRCRAVIEGVRPELDAGRFPIKRVVGESVTVAADVFTDGHDAVRCQLLYRHESESAWTHVELEPLGNDRWQGSFVTSKLGRYRYTLLAWTDRFLTWQRELERRREREDLLLALRTGAQLLTQTAGRARGVDADELKRAAASLTATQDAATGRAAALDPKLRELASRYPDQRFAVRYPRELGVVVDSPLAKCSAWYEFFPRSAAAEPGRHGTFQDCEARLEYVAGLGFDVVYLPPIHPIGRVRRKGPNNALQAGPEDPGSPWAIGAKEGGHCAIHPALGTLQDFQRLNERARSLGIALALDIAFQCAPDHPLVTSHPEWFRFRPDGTVQYAENPPKKYEDIYPFDFESDAWEALHRELTDVVLYWAEQGVRVFRIDNPHTKPFPLWESLIATVKARYPETIFLAEAFTRPKVMHRLAKLGFTQSYTYFAWRNTKHELETYIKELAHGPGVEYFRPNVWPNTPDILTEFLQHSGRAGFMIRAVLAATLAANYGIYGPAFEHMEHLPREPGSEEYLHSEKYQLRHWQLDRQDSLAPFLARLNRIRRDHPALRDDASVRFLDLDNEQLIAYAKVLPDPATDALVIIVNLDPYHAHTGWLTLPLAELGLEDHRAYRMYDLLGGASFLWQGSRNFVQLDPRGLVAHVFRVAKHVRTERDFDYFL